MPTPLQPDSAPRVTRHRARRAGVIRTAIFASLLTAMLAGAGSPAQAQDDRKQTRAAKSRVPVPVEKIQVDDGDTVNILWGPGDTEIIRILGIDTPETQHVEHNLPFDQPFGREARGFGLGAFAAAQQVELLRAEMTDPYGRTLGYLFINGVNYSVLVVRAGLAAESVSHYGDNRFPDEAAAVAAATKEAGALPFENPWDYRKRMRIFSDAQKAGQR